MVIVLMGVAGSGKTSVGQLLAQRLGWQFRDADDFHPASNRAKMGRGVPLDDNDRRPWLNAVRALLVQFLARGENAIVACSALKESYRQALAGQSEPIKFVYLKGSLQLIAGRLVQRHGHFFDPALLRTQFDDLEEPRGVLAVDITPPPEAIGDCIITALRLTNC